MEKQKNFPLDIKVSFHKLIERYQDQLKNDSSGISRDYIEKMLEYVTSFPKLTEGIEKAEDLVKFQDPIKILLRDLFPVILTNNEIKAVSIPFHNLVFNSSEKFQKIIERAGPEYTLSLRNLNEDSIYIFGCLLILNGYYDYQLDFSRPLYYDIPDKNGILRHYRVKFNSEFMEITPTENAPQVKEEEVDLLLQNIEDAALWKKMFPPKSWIYKGFTIINLTDVTVDDAISDLKTKLLEYNISNDEELDKFREVFQSIFKIPDLEVGFTSYNDKEGILERTGKEDSSFILNRKTDELTRKLLGEEAYEILIQQHAPFIISNVDSFFRDAKKNNLAKNLLNRGAKSVLLAPIAKNKRLLGILELISFRKNELNSINAIKLEDVLPYIVTSVERNRTEYENRIKAVIQSECTSIHPSVLWIFEKEARRYIRDIDDDGLASFKDIVFEDIHPLYGQIDIVASSEARNQAIQKDLLHQLSIIEEIINLALKAEKLIIYEQVLFRIREFMEELEQNLNASSEQKVFNLLQKEVDPLLEHLKKQDSQLSKKIIQYYEKTSPETGIIYNHRKVYDEAVQQINRTMSRNIDQKQIEAQKIYPHYFERYKTDGVEHNIYIGGSLTSDKHLPFDQVYLYNLRLWQLSTMVEMENKFYRLQEEMPITLEAASLILVFSSTLSIRYRMDEKKFDVDGTYNARYEIIKKRIDKACIKGTDERVTQKGKLAIIYSQRSDEKEYLRYIQYLQAKKYLGEEVELLELEDVQGVIGLKVIRVKILYNLDDDAPEKVITYEDLIEELNSEGKMSE
ncbi:MAG TPA: GAF domain-containing protein [Salinimicrobium sp.]|nr:GAF domain-containing protein [Salinimicrobium sp.]